MASNYTTNYQLNQWEAGDQVLRTEFNQDNQKIDTAVAGKADLTQLSEVEALALGRADILLGSYTGDGASSRTIDLGGKPRAVLLLTASGDLSDSFRGTRYGGLALAERAVTGVSGQTVLAITEQGFTVCYNSNYSIYSNSNGSTYLYLAVF